MAPSGSLVLLIVVLPQKVLTAVNENAAAKKIQGIPARSG
jgi:hypothetical protein